MCGMWIEGGGLRRRLCVVVGRLGVGFLAEGLCHDELG